MEPSPVTGAADRTIVGYKSHAATEDPYALDSDPSNDHLITVKWRNPPVNLPEAGFLGVQYVASPVNVAFVVNKPGHWIYTGTGLQLGSKLPGLVGHEVDAVAANTPAGAIKLGHSPFGPAGSGSFSDMTIYTAASGAMVWASGTFKWSWGLDDFNAPDIRPSVISPAAQRMTRNLLAKFAGR
jgi:hypothetical protein